MSDINNKTVGIIIPCKNHGKHLKRAVDSIILQNYPTAICIVNDGSTDDTENLARQLFTKVTDDTLYNNDAVTNGFINNIPLILINKEKCEKQAKARNIAIKMLWDHVGYFCQLDADDYYLEGKLQKSVEVMDSDPYIGLVYSDAIVHNSIKDVWVHELKPAFNRHRLEFENIITNAPLIKKDVFLKIGLYDEDLPPCEDWDMWLRITEKYGAVHIPEPLHVYNVTGENCFFTIEAKIWNEQIVKIKQKLKERKNGTNK